MFAKQLKIVTVESNQEYEIICIGEGVMCEWRKE